MPADQAATLPVTLRFALTVDDWVDVCTAQQRRGSSGFRSLLWVAVLLGVFFAFGFRDRDSVLRSWMVPLLVIFALASVVFLAARRPDLPLLRRLSRRLLRTQAENLMRGNPTMAQPMEVTVSAAGVVAATATVYSTHNWLHFPCFYETDRSFLLLTSEGLNAVVLALPKRGLGGVDPAALRALLDAHSRRVP